MLVPRLRESLSRGWLSLALFALNVAEFRTRVLVPRLRESIAVVSVRKTRSQLLFKRLRVANHLPGKAGECACLASLGQRRNRLARANQALVQDRVAGEHSISKC